MKSCDIESFIIYFQFSPHAMYQAKLIYFSQNWFDFFIIIKLKMRLCNQPHSVQMLNPCQSWKVVAKRSDNEVISIKKNKK